jgi:2-oxoglutarate ferredoxin oxidoreductase subunit alpha
MVIEAMRLAMKYMTPVFFLSDGYLANGSDPWKIPSLKDLPDLKVQHPTDPKGFSPYKRDPQTLARPWAIPGTPGLEHRLGGIEKQDVTGNVSYDPENHHHMVRTRAAKIAGIAREIPPTPVFGPKKGKVLVVGWGSTYGSITQAVKTLQSEGESVASVHLRHLNPLPPDLEGIMRSYDKVLVPEINMGQLLWILRSRFLIPAEGFNVVRGQPLKVREIKNKIMELLGKGGK